MSIYSPLVMEKVSSYEKIMHFSVQDELQLRHKTLPIPICVNLCQGDDRKVEVNSGFPLIDIVPVICNKLGGCGLNYHHVA